MLSLYATPYVLCPKHLSLIHFTPFTTPCLLFTAIPIHYVQSPLTDILSAIPFSWCSICYTLFAIPYLLYPICYTLYARPNLKTPLALTYLLQQVHPICHALFTGHCALLVFHIKDIFDIPCSIYPFKVYQTNPVWVYQINTNHVPYLLYSILYFLFAIPNLLFLFALPYSLHQIHPMCYTFVIPYSLLAMLWLLWLFAIPLLIEPACYTYMLYPKCYTLHCS